VTRLIASIAIALTLTLAGCGGDSGESGGDTTSATEQNTIDITVRVVSQQVGLGCTSTSVIGNGSQLVIEDGAGTKLAIGEWQLTPKVETCDWTADAFEVPEAELHTIVGDGQEMGTVAFDDLGGLKGYVLIETSVGGISIVSP